MDQRSASNGEHWNAERVRALRAWLEASQSGLADRLGTRQQTVSEWETGSSEPRRMSRRLLHLVAEESGFYGVERARPEGPDGSDGDGPEGDGSETGSEPA